LKLRTAAGCQTGSKTSAQPTVNRLSIIMQPCSTLKSCQQSKREELVPLTSPTGEPS
jgi:hypothetical protein